uniref:MFS transporter n=1 Tax=Bellilinea caldifistulae TaxID=360411 RepID=A0A7C4Q1W8_9CHLR
MAFMAYWGIREILRNRWVFIPSASQIGILGFLQNGLGAIYALFGGFVTDRFGHKRSLFLFALLNLLGYALLLVPHWGVVLAATFFYMGWSQLSLPATFSLVAEQLPQHKRVMGLAVQAVVRRIPMAVGPVLGGAILTYYGTVQGMPYVVGLAALLTLVAVWMNLRLSTAERSSAQYERLDLRGLWKTFRPQLKRLLISAIQRLRESSRDDTLHVPPCSATFSQLAH